MDVYRKQVGAERNFFRYALFVSFFPQLVAGPIERSENLLKQIREKHEFNLSACEMVCCLCFGHEDYEEYRDYKLGLINSCDDIITYLMLLNDTNFEIKLYLTRDSQIYQDSMIMELVKNMDTLGELTYVFGGDGHYEGNITIEVMDRRTRQIVSTMNYSRVRENVYDMY